MFCLVGLASLIGCIPFTYYCYLFTIKASKDAPLGYNFPDPYDFWMTAVAAIVFGLLDLLCYKLFTPCFRPYCKIQDDVEQREQRSIKTANSIFRLSYFTGITIFGYIAVLDSEFFPSALGGSGNYDLCTSDFPYQEHNYKVKVFLLVSLGFHCAMLMKMVFIS